MGEYVITLTNGITFIARADSVEYLERSNHIRFYNGKTVVARFNMDNIAGWAKSKYFTGKIA